MNKNLVNDIEGWRTLLRQGFEMLEFLDEMNGAGIDKRNLEFGRLEFNEVYRYFPAIDNGSADIITLVQPSPGQDIKLEILHEEDRWVEHGREGLVQIFSIPDEAVFYVFDLVQQRLRHYLSFTCSKSREVLDELRTLNQLLAKHGVPDVEDSHKSFIKSLDAMSHVQKVQTLIDAGILTKDLKLRSMYGGEGDLEDGPMSDEGSQRYDPREVGDESTRGDPR